jgi:ABC-2 type transport system permease protein
VADPHRNHQESKLGSPLGGERRALLSRQVAYRLRILRVLSRTEFKLKYAGSVLGYFWSLAKPLLYFSVLWLVFGHLFRTTVPQFPLYLLIGIVLYTFLADAVALTLPSIVARGAVLRRIAFPSLVIPMAITLSTAVTFFLNCLAVAAFIAISGITPRGDWLLLVPLMLELLAFSLGLGLLFSSLYVRFRDVSQIWEVLATVLLFTSPIMYPMRILPGRLQKVVSANPLVQVIQDSRRLIMTEGNAGHLVFIAVPRVVPIGVAFATLAFGLWIYRRESPRFPELA